jgi:hypothetical protein
MAYLLLEAIYLHAICEYLISRLLFLVLFFKFIYCLINPASCQHSIGWFLIQIPMQNYNAILKYTNKWEGSVLHPLKDSDIVRPDLQLDMVCHNTI